MSVINTMLRRLDARGVKPPMPGLPNMLAGMPLQATPPHAPGYLHIESAHGAPIQVQPRDEAPRGRVVVRASVITAIALAAAWLYSGEPKPSSPAKLPKPPAITPMAAGTGAAASSQLDAQAAPAAAPTPTATPTATAAAPAAASESGEPPATPAVQDPTPKRPAPLRAMVAQPASLAPAQPIAIHPAAMASLGAGPTAALLQAAGAGAARATSPPKVQAGPTSPAATVAAAPQELPPLPARVDKRLPASTPELRAHALYGAALEAAQAGQSRAAIAKAQEALAAYPPHTAARQLAAALEQETGGAGRAIGLLKDGLALAPGQPALALALARVQAQQGLADDALATLEQHAVPGAEAQGLRGGVLARRADYAGALGAYEAAARAQPQNSLWWLGLGVSLEALGEPARARIAFGKAQALGLAREDLSQYVQERLLALP
jgi:MSHA biogenesis protein MshN